MRAALEEVAAVGVQALSGSASGTDLLRREPERAATTSSTGRRNYGTVTEERLALARRATALRRDGRLIREIAAELHVSRSYASALLNDPDGAQARARKDSYRRSCPSCGKPMTGCYGPAHQPGLCITCSRIEQSDAKVWTDAAVIAALRRFYDRYGRAPAAHDTKFGLAPSQRSKFSPERFAEIEKVTAEMRLPVPGTVAARFGSWNDGLRAAGLPLNRTGTPSHRSRRTPRAVRVEAEGFISPEILAARCGIGASQAQRHLADAVQAGHATKIRRGVYRLDPGLEQELISRKRRTRIMRSFIVFARNGDNGWHEQARVDAHNHEQAVEQTADQAGAFVAIDARYFQPVTVQPVTKLTVIKQPE